MNTYIEKENYYEIHITGNKHEGVILIDKDDYDKCKLHSWYIKDGNPVKYVACKYQNKTIKLHRFLLNVNDKNIIIDHKNRNTFDNRKNNLRLTNHLENNKNCSMSKNNTSGRTGVYYSKGKGNRSPSFKCQATNNNKKVSKSFSIKKYGYELAFELACEQREKWEKEFNILTEKRSTTIETTLKNGRE